MNNMDQKKADLVSAATDAHLAESHIVEMDRAECLDHLGNLHDQVAKLFKPSKQTFDLNQLSSKEEAVPDQREELDLSHENPVQTEDDNRHFSEDDYRSHRRASFPHTHHPLKAIHSKSARHAKSDKKHKKRKKKVGSPRHSGAFPSKNAVAAPSIPEVDVEAYSESTNGGDHGDWDNDAQETDQLLAADDIFGDNIGSGESESVTESDDDVIDGEIRETAIISDSDSLDTPQVSKPPVPEIKVGFFIGDRDGMSSPAVTEPSSTAELVIPVPSAHPSQASAMSVEAHKFQSQVQDEPMTSPSKFYTATFGDAVAEPSRSAAQERPYLSEDAHLYQREEFDTGTKVSFQLGGDASYVSLNNEGITDYHQDPNHLEVPPPKHMQDESEGKSNKQKHRYGHSSFKQKDLRLRTRRGSEVKIPTMMKHSPTEKEEALRLHKADLDEIASHRWDDVRGVRRHKIAKHNASSTVVHIGKTAKVKKKIFTAKPKFDHSPHEMFVELDELHYEEHGEFEWREKARWIKFEEDVEEGAERWGKPHVASLSFHSLLELRQGLEKGCVLLDLVANDLPSIIYNIVEAMVLQDIIRPEQRGDVLRTLLSKHRHVFDHRGTFIRRNFSHTNLMGLDSSGSKRPVVEEEDNIIQRLSTVGLDSSSRFIRRSSSAFLRVSDATRFNRRRATAANIADSTRANLQRRLTAANVGMSDSSRSTSPNIAGMQSGRETPRHQGDKSMHRNLSSQSFPSLKDLVNASTKAGVGVLDEKFVNKSSGHYISNGHHTGNTVPAKTDMFQTDIESNMQSDGLPHIGLHPVDAHQKRVQDILRRIPVGSEACSILVGCVEYLENPAVAFVRLSEGQQISNFLEVPLPVRFIVVILGSAKGTMDYHEVGRSICTLMSNQHFHSIAYKFESRDELLHAINEFLDESIVLPPGDWDQKTLLPIMDMARKRANIKRKKKRLEEKASMKDLKVPSDPLQRTGCLFGGLVNDIKRRYPHYLSDFTDALSLQCFLTFLFIFFACMAPCIAFGGLIGEQTKGLMGVTETILATSISGVIFALFSGQPLMALGATGPVLVFEKSLFTFCESNDIEFLVMRVWVGVWFAVISLVVVAAEGSFLIHLVTRFMEEIFAILISFIFIYEVIKKLDETFLLHPLVTTYCDLENGYQTDSVLSSNNSTNNSTNISSVISYSVLSQFNDTNKTMSVVVPVDQHKYTEPVNQPNTALLSTILIIGTFFIAYFLRVFRNSTFLGRSARRALGDFGILIAMAVMTLLDVLVRDTYTQKLDIPLEFGPTSKRDWVVNPMGVNKKTELWQIFAAIIPAFLVFMLIFLETQITEMILNKKDRKLKKGSGFHLDQVLVGLLVFGCSLFGLPWMCAATVRTIAHTSALSVFSKTHAPGEKPQLVEVKEQRVTMLGVNTLIGVSLTFGPLLRAIPLPVLFGVFLYLGISSLTGIQLFERVKLLLVPVKHHPSVGFVRRVRTLKMHVFTIIQLFLLIVLWIVKSTAASLAFPFGLIMLIPIRLKILPRFFSEKELAELDREEDEEEDEEDEPDFYQQAHMPI